MNPTPIAQTRVSNERAAPRNGRVGDSVWRGTPVPITVPPDTMLALLELPPFTDTRKPGPRAGGKGKFSGRFEEAERPRLTVIVVLVCVVTAGLEDVLTVETFMEVLNAEMLEALPPDEWYAAELWSYTAPLVIKTTDVTDDAFVSGSSKVSIAAISTWTPAFSVVDTNA